MSKISIIGIFEACRKEFFPTPEEAAERDRINEIKNLCRDLDLAVRGMRLGEVSKEDARMAMFAMGGIYGVGYAQPPLINLNEQQKQFHIAKISDELLTKGISQEKIDGIIAHAKNCMENPKRTWFGYPESYD